MKKLSKILASFTAATALLIGVGCTNQADYVEDTTAIAKMKILGFTVSGLDASYDQAEAKLMIKEGVDADGNDNMVSAGSTTVAKYTATEGYKSGTAYVKFDDPYVYDGETLHSSEIELFLQVGNDEFKIANTEDGKYENAVLSVKTSPAGTSDDALVSNYVVVNVYDGVASYSFASSVTEPFSVPVYMCDFDISTAASASDLPAGVTIDLADKSGTNNKYTVIFKGLTENVGTKFVVAGASISSTDSNLGDNWNIMETAGLKVSAVVTDKGLVSEVDSEGTVKFVFYGAQPSWASNASPAIKIAAYNVDTDPWTCLLAANGGNFFFPDYTDGHDVTMTVDLTELDSDNWEKSKAQAEAVSFYIDGIKVVNAPAPKDGKVYFTDGDDDDERIMFVPENGWGTSCHYYTDSEINSNGNFSWVFDEPVKIVPNSTTFKLGARLCNPEADGGFWDNQVGSYTTHYVTSEYADKNLTLIIDGKSGYEYLMLSSAVDYEFEVTLNKLIVNKALDNVELIGGFNSWANTGTIAGTVGDETTEFDISSIAANDLGEIKIRTVKSWDDVNIGYGTGNITLPVYSKSGKVNIVCEYTSGTSVDSVKLEYVD
ncbi:MAG: hypothetical protein J6I53_09175 [Treponema sp.]|nr:hypothetical protein [Treponema sp.]